VCVHLYEHMCILQFTIKKFQHIIIVSFNNLDDDKILILLVKYVFNKI
jgi:hypothetical protein